MDRLLILLAVLIGIPFTASLLGGSGQIQGYYFGVAVTTAACVYLMADTRHSSRKR